MENRFSDQSECSTAGVGEMVGEYPLTSTMMALGLGFGVGVAIGAALAAPSERQRGFAERVGSQILDAMSQRLPEAFSKRSH